MKNRKIICMVVGVACFTSFSFGRSEVLVELDFEALPVGEQPDFTEVDPLLFPPLPDYLSIEFVQSLLGFTPTSNTDTNGVVVIDRSFEPLPNPLSGKSLLVYDRNSGGSTHFRFPFYWPSRDAAETLNRTHTGVTFDFQRAYTVDQGDRVTGIHVALGRKGDSLNNPDFRPFELRILNNGTLALNSLGGTQTIGAYDVASANQLGIMANSHDTEDLIYNSQDYGVASADIDDAVPPNSLHVWLNGEKLGEYNFHATPGGPGIDFTQQDTDLGQIAFYQDIEGQGGIVFDNLILLHEREDGDNGDANGGPGPTTKLVNISARAFVGTGGEVLIGGFIIRGDGEQEVLVQALGPELANAGISNPLADPVLTVTTPDGMVLMENDNWEDSQRQMVIDAWGGSPNLAAGSASSAAILTLGPGSYTAKVEGKDGTTGVAIVEVYDIN